MNAQQLQQRLDVLDDVLLVIDGRSAQLPLLLDVEIHPVQRVGDDQIVGIAVIVPGVNIRVGLLEGLRYIVGAEIAVGVVIVERFIRREGADPPVGIICILAPLLLA